MTVMRVRASMGESTRIRLAWDRIGHAAAKGLTETPVENQGPEMPLQDVQEFIYSEGIQYGCSMAQAIASKVALRREDGCPVPLPLLRHGAS